MRSRLLVVLMALSQFSGAGSGAKKIPVSNLLDQMVHRSTLAEPSGRPFYLKATIRDRDDDKAEVNGTVEEYWVSPTKWRRVIKLRDFSQTRVVNGDKVYEENNGDYFPVHAEKLANEIVDPLPPPAVDLVKKLGMEVTEPGSGTGQCMAEKYFKNEEGRDSRVLLAYDCKTGVLIYLSSPSCCYGVMSDYRKFHDKLVAFATKDETVNIRIDTLRDLDTPEEAMFAIAQPTPPEKRIAHERMSEAGARKLILEQGDIHWPPVSKKPDSGNVNVSLVIGRDGHVKEAWSYSAVENAISDAAIEAVQKWTFRTQTVDGVPAQVEAELTIPFSSELKGPVANEREVRPVFDRMRVAGDLRLEGAPGFHLKANFQSQDGTEKGIYEETWVSPKKWRREIKLKDSSLVEVRTEDAFYRTFPGKFASRVSDDVIDAIAFQLPGDNGTDLHDSDWRAEDVVFGGIGMLSVTRGYVDPQGRPDAQALRYMAQEKEGYIRGRFHYGMLTVFNDLQPFGNKKIARKVSTFDVLKGRIDITIDTLEATTASDDTFKLPGVKPLYTSEEGDGRFTPARLVYTAKASIPGWHGKATCDLFLDEHGHVREVDVKGTTDESVIRAIRAAVMQYEYEPAAHDGRPMMSPAHVHFE